MISFTEAIAAGIVITMLVVVAPIAWGVFINHKQLDDWRKFDWKRFFITTGVVAVLNFMCLVYFLRSIGSPQ